MNPELYSEKPSPKQNLEQLEERSLEVVESLSHELEQPRRQRWRQERWYLIFLNWPQGGGLKRLVGPNERPLERHEFESVYHRPLAGFGNRVL